ncbi:non-homologous end-joining DNA ligase [Patulibacter sp.]|uniref:non-homologous end-joining DNA ligase n=1 Tax=Patulibacter sp. TaxID=1912859 RepID=UPI0027254A2E|nr:non-homologous end-joining DNA ligase [Patulibacter sp.]MDO9409071.1 non-homologous end-joining DNA ligase [Patulibacter sp.]
MAEPLQDYRRKRSFADTPEPSGDEDVVAGDAPRFVVHEHHATRLHWDLRLEHDGALVSFAIPNGIPTDPEHNRKAVHTEDHPLKYLDFEATIPEGNYGAGEMTIWDAGTFEVEKWRTDEIIVVFSGGRLTGRYALFHAGKDPKDWMIHRMDAPVDESAEEMPDAIEPMLAKPGELPRRPEDWAFEVKWDGVRAMIRSQPGRFHLFSRAGNDITGAYPELRALNRQLSSHEAILDGEVVAFDDDGRPSFQALQSRMHARGAHVKRLARERPVTLMVFDLLWLDGHSLVDRPWTERRAALEELGLDGDHWQTPGAYVGQGEGLLAATAEQGLEGVIAKRTDATYRPGRRSDAWLKVKNEMRQEFVVGGWLPGKGGRKGVLGSLQLGVHDADGALRYAGGVGTGFDQETLKALTAKLERLERKTSPFEGRQPPREARFCTPSLVVEVRFAEWTSDGSVRQGAFQGLRDDKDAKDVVRETPATTGPAVDADETAGPGRATTSGGRSTSKGDTPSTGAPTPDAPASADPHHVPDDVLSAALGGRPETGAPVEAAVVAEPDPPVVPDAPEPDGPDVEPDRLIPASGKSVEIEVEGRTLKLSNLDKPLYPGGFTKADVLRYYAAIAPIALPHWRDRPMTLKRYPNGVDEKAFFQKHADKHRPDWVATTTVPHGRKDGTVDFVLVQDLPTLLWAANLAAIELHPSLSLGAPEAEYGVTGPRALVFDLDPGPGASIVDCCRVALAVRDVLARFELQAFCKTSGSKGLQLYAPLADDASYGETKPFARWLARFLEEHLPDLVVSKMAKELRDRKVLIDWSQNDQAKTTIGVYSLRARPRPSVSTPVDWDEVEACERSDDPETLVFLADRVLARVAERGDLFAPLTTLEQRLPELNL